MPFEVCPRIFRFWILRPPGSIVPVGANGYSLPAFTFGAPHTTSSSSPVPMSTFVMWRWSESGMRRLFDDLADHDVGEIAAQRDHLLDRRGVRGEEIAKLGQPSSAHR